MSVMEDVGYYKGVDGDSANMKKMEEHLAWGAGKDCDAFSGSCVIHPHRCRESSRVCSPDFKSMGGCARDEYVEQCNVFKTEKYQDCIYSGNKARLVASGDVPGAGNMGFGLESRCMMGIVDDTQKDLVNCQGLGCNAQPACMKMTCDYNNSGVLLGITIDLPENSVNDDGSELK